MSQSRPTDIQINTYSENFVLYGDKSRAWRITFPTSKCKPKSVHERASMLHTLVKVQSRIEELRIKCNILASESFTISVKKRLEWLKDITEAGLGTYKDANDTERREGLSAAKSAIDTMNTMLGVSDNDGDVKPVKIFVGVNDAS